MALFDLWYLSRQSTDTVAVLYGVTIVVIAVVGSALAFVLPLTGRSKLSVGEQLTQSARLALGKPHIAFAALLLNIWPIIVVLIAPEQTLMLACRLARGIFVGRRSQLLGADESDPQDLLARLDSVRIPANPPKILHATRKHTKRRTAIWPCGVFAS